MKSNTFHYLVLAVILLGGLATFWYLSGDRTMQLAVGVMTSVSYVLWGLIHHRMRRDLYPRVVIEYVLVGLIAIVLLVTLAV